MANLNDGWKLQKGLLFVLIILKKQTVLLKG